MIWEKTRKRVLVVGEEEFGFEIKVPTALEMEDILFKAKAEEPKDSEIVRKFLLSIDGFRDVEDFINCPQAHLMMRAIASEVIKAATLPAEVKN